MKKTSLFVALFSFAAAYPLTAAAQTAAVKKAPIFSLKDQNSQSLELVKYRGKVVLLNFWATWCAPCRVEMPWFEEFSNRYRDRGLIVVGLSMDEDGWTAVRPALGRLKITYPISLGKRALARSYGVNESLPSTFLIDRNGIIRSSVTGFGKKKDFEQMIEQQLSSK
ncbi:TlpA disulfide reductase family protein [Terriglobus sp. 2YAB30_2]|uniref:TlpA disulfide reductase family protein n=1 Tax=unclassified Terriglobus TaxID=2628988 RepID=UPI003F9AF719